jgi:Gluconate 2-dehydrogenase subunit 3
MARGDTITPRFIAGAVMKNHSLLPVLKDASKRGMNRRQMVERMFGVAGAAFALPGLAAAHPIRKHLASPAVLEAADAQAAAVEWSPEFFDLHQNETFTALAERMVPGSTEARVNRFVDLLLSVDSMESRTGFLAALSAFDAEAIRHHGRPFKDLTEEQQNQILTKASTSGSAPPPGNSYREEMEPPALPSTNSQAQTLRDHFEYLKGWVSGAYYSSEVGMKDLGWDGNNFYSGFPGCQHPDEHH